MLLHNAAKEGAPCASSLSILAASLALTAAAQAQERNLIALANGEADVVFVRSFAAPREKVFEAFTDDAVAIRWMGMTAMAMTACEIDPKTGGALRYVWRTEDGNDVVMHGRFTAFHPPERYAHTETFEDNWTGGEAMVETVFEAAGMGTRVTTTIRYATAQIRDDVFGDALIDAVMENYDNLDIVLAGE
ncbi:MAG: SRPBCC domain-containing protein [Parvularculaceae bacterium]